MKNISKYDALKTKAVFLYVLNKMGEANMLSALKIIYFANKEHMVRYGRPLIEDDFIAMERGPVPSFLYDGINCAKGKKHMERPNVDILKGTFKSLWPHALRPIEVPDMDELSKSDIICLDFSIAENGKLSPEELSDKSHLDSAWEIAYAADGRMNTLQMARDSGASEEMLRLIQEKEEFSRLRN